MTISVKPTRNEYTATAAQTVFNYTFKIFADTDLNVYQTAAGAVADDATDIITAYTVTGVGLEDGGSITLTTPATAGDLITIVSDIPDNRTTDYQNNGDFLPDTVNDDLDRTVSLVKQANDKSARTLILQESQQSADSLILPRPVAGNYVKWRADLLGMENTGVPGVLIPSNTFGVVADMVADTTLSIGDIIQTIGYTTKGDGGDNMYEVVAAGTGTDDGGSYIDLNTHQAQGLFPGNNYNVNQFGATGDGVTDDSAAINNALAYAETVGKMSFLLSTYVCDSVWNSINTGIKLEGAATGSTEIDFSSVAAGTCVSFAQTASLTNVYMSDIKITGPGKASAVTGLATGTGTYSCTTSRFENVNVNNFLISYNAKKTWSVLYDKCVFSQCDQGLVGDNFNNNQFDTCDFVNCNQFWEIEQGDQVIFNNPKFQNILSGSSYTEIFKSVGSHIILNNPYIESIQTLDYIVVGSNNFPNILDGFTWNGGTGPGDKTIWYRTNRVKISVNGVWVTGGGPPIKIAVLAGRVTYLPSCTHQNRGDTDRISYDGEIVVEYWWDNHPSYEITGSSGQSKEITHDKYLNLSYPGSGSSWNFTHSGQLTPGDSYTLIYAFRKEAALTSLLWRELTAGVEDHSYDMSATIAATTEDWEVRYVSFIATGDQLQLNHNNATKANNLQVKFAILVTGHCFARRPDLNRAIELYAAAAPTTLTWWLGDRVWETDPASAATPGWICTESGTFGAASDVTGDTDGSTNVITGMTDTSDFLVGDFVDVSAGFAGTGPYEVLALTATTMTITEVSNAVVADITVDTSDPVFTAMANLA